MDNRRFTLFLVLSTLILFLSYGEPVPPPNEQDGKADQKAASDDPENSSGEADGAEAPPETVPEDATEQVEEKPDELVKLPGVGRKTANVVLNIAFGQPTMAVDTHIFRLGNRTGMAPGKNVDQVEAKLVKRIPAKWMNHAHHWLILHGRYVCKARKPGCWNCIVKDLCRFKGKTEE